jgi:hypothetical protein
MTRFSHLTLVGPVSDTGIKRHEQEEGEMQVVNTSESSHRVDGTATEITERDEVTETSAQS